MNPMTFDQASVILHQLRNGGAISISDAQGINKALRGYDAMLKASLGGIVQGQAFAGGDTVGGVATGTTAPMVPQSLMTEVAVLGATMKQCRLTNALPKADVVSTLFEDVTVTRVGTPHVKGFIGEGIGGSVSTAGMARGTVKIKMESSRRQVPYLGTAVNMLGLGPEARVDKNMLKNEQWLAMQELLVRHETNLFLSHESYDSLSYNGIYQQIAGSAFAAGVPSNTPAGNYEDARGAVKSGGDLLQFLATMGSSPGFGYPTKCYVHPKYFSALQALGQDMVRTNVDSGGVKVIDRFNFGARGIWLVGLDGSEILVEPAPLMLGWEDRVTATGALGEAPPDSSAVVLAVASNNDNVNTGKIAAGGSGSLFAAGDAGEYIYRITPVGPYGTGTPIVVPSDGAVTVAAGQSVSIELPDIAATSTLKQGTQGAGDTNKNRVLSYRVERSRKDGVVGTTTFMWEYPGNTSGTGGRTLIVDANLHVPGTAPIWFISMLQEYIYWAELLGVHQLPLPMDTNLNIPFIDLWFGAPRVRAPVKHGIFDNVAWSL